MQVAQGSLSDLSKKIVPVAAVIVIFLLLVFATIATKNILPFWQYVLGLLILLVVRGWLLFGSTTSPPAGQQASRWDSLRSKISFGGIVRLAILLAVLALLYGVVVNISGTPDRIYPAKELQNLTTSGTWKLQGDELVCNGNYYNSCEIVIPNQGNIGGLTIDPGMTALPDTDVNIGDEYLIKYYFQNLTDCDGKRDGGKYHKAVLYYGGIASVNWCSSVKDDGAAESLWIGTTYGRLFGSFPGLFWSDNEDPKVFIGARKIMASWINKENQEYLGGNIKISSKKTIVIREVRIAHSSYRWREFYKIIGIKI